MLENFIIEERNKLQDFKSFHFIFAINFICDKNVIVTYMVYNITYTNTVINNILICSFSIIGIRRICKFGSYVNIHTYKDL